MNTTAIPLNSSDHSWNRRCSTETILSIQGRETDYARDTSDSEALSDDGEYEPVTEPEEEAPVDGDTTAGSDNDIIATKVIEVSVGDDGDLVFADSERTDDTQSDSEIDFNDYWNCAQCRAVNDSPVYRYCQKCFQVRKRFFPPRPRRKHKRSRLDSDLPYKHTRIDRDAPEHSSQETRALSQDSRALSQDSRALSQDSRALSQDSRAFSQDSGALSQDLRALSQDSGVETQGTSQEYDNVSLCKGQKRRAGSLDRSSKRAKYSDASDSDGEIIPLSKSISDPSVAIENITVTKKVIADTLKELETKELCIVCISEPKSGVFVHGRLAHICCCYKCAVKVWVKTKRCPICNRKINNVLRAVVM